MTVKKINVKTGNIEILRENLPAFTHAKNPQEIQEETFTRERIIFNRSKMEEVLGISFEEIKEALRGFNEN